MCGEPGAMPRKGENAGAVKGKGMFALPDYFHFLTGGTQRKTPKERRKRAKEAGGDGMAGSPASSHVQSVESPAKSPANRCDREAELRPACPHAA